MGGRLLLVLVLLTRPGAADPHLFDKIRDKQAITLALPNGHCDAKVVKHDRGELTIRLKKTTNACGERKWLVRVSRSDVWDVVDDRQSHEPFSAHCAALVMTAVLSTAGFAVGEVTGSNLALGSILGAGAVAGALLCRERHPVIVFTDRIAPAHP
jgi:hypothetical protein